MVGIPQREKMEPAERSERKKIRATPADVSGIADITAAHIDPNQGVKNRKWR